MKDAEKEFLDACNNVKRHIVPYKTNLKKVRVGDEMDGGYVLCDLDNYDALYSYGSNDQISFEKHFYKKYEKPCYVYDHTIDRITDKPEYIHFFKEGVSDVKSTVMDTVDNHIEKNGHTESKNLLAQIDIEGGEWNMFNNIKYLTNFSQILVEFHMYTVDFIRKRHIVDYVFSKINKDFVCVHVHGNNGPVQPWLDVNLPIIFECTFVRKDLVTEKEIEPEMFPVKSLDFPNDPERPDLTLNFWHSLT